MPVYVRSTDHITEAHDRAPGQGAESRVRVMGDLGATYGATRGAVAGAAGTIGGVMPAYVRTTDHVMATPDRAPGQGAEYRYWMMGNLGPMYGVTRNLGATTNPLTGVAGSLDIGALAYVRASQNSGWTNGLVLGHCGATDSQRVIYDER